MSILLKFILFSFLSVPALAQTEGGEGLTQSSTVALELHKENYIFPYTEHNEKPLGGNDFHEFKFQISLKANLVNIGVGSLAFAYTQKSFWQVYDDQNSRPFREHNYNPEIFLRIGNRLNNIDLGYEHESNGKEDPESRSWDRVYLKVQFTSKYFRMALKGWAITDSDEYGELYPERPDSMEDYYGKGEFEVGFFINGTIIKGLMRYNTETYHSYSESKILWKFIGTTFWGFTYTKGYGNSLRTYNIETETYGVGLVFNP